VTPYELEVREPLQPGVTIVALAGEVDLTNAPEIERRLEQMFGAGGLVLDLNGVTFLDSAALHMLFRLARSAGSVTSFGIVLEPTAVVARTLAIVGMAEVATIRPTVDELVPDPLS
jgi:anti-anti-sigma factor